MARKRQRAKARKQKLRRENVPGSLDNASAEVDEVEASIVAGADGKPEPLDDDFDPDVAGDETLDREQLGVGAADVASPASARKPSNLRVVNFARACVAELSRVDWPDRRQTGQATTVVLGFVVIAGAFLGLADTVAQRIIDFII
ncbi:MAG: preprotein translocase subunit SecE [Solirubrobacteraceae bacterium]